MLRDYLRYVESGGRYLGQRMRPSVDLNPFERDVLHQLTAVGLDLECQVGASGFCIDFAAKHPTEPGRYVLAIEADGAMYHSSETARDRDRLRQDHLERLGWRFYRIWSTDWFCHRDREVARVLEAFNDALAETHLPNRPPPVQSQHSTDDVSGEDGTTVPGRIGPRPFRPDGRQITEYPDFELVRFMRWIMSDGQLRTTDELVTIGTRELGFRARGHRIVAALEQAIATVKRTEGLA